jgi:Icc-related predicted phosphoesterase
MRIVAISDTHDRHDQIQLPEGDILIHGGDLSMRGNLVEVRRFLDWFENQPFTERIFIAGNHDFLFQEDPGIAKALVEEKFCHYLQDDLVEIHGLKIYGSPWQPWLHNWAFNIKRDTGTLAVKWSKIPDDTDILITHGPPHGILDLTYDTNENVGCEALLERVKEVKPKIHIFGHIHETYGVKEGTYTIFVNASNLNLDYEVVNKPIVLDDSSGVWEVVDE